MLNSSPTLQNITTCVAKVSFGNKEASAQDQQKALLGCADATKQATGLIDDFKKTQALTDCQHQQPVRRRPIGLFPEVDHCAPRSGKNGQLHLGCGECN